MNQVILAGVLYKAPTVKTLTSGKTVANMIVVTTDTFEKDGQVQTINQYNKCVAWGKTAESVKDLLEGSRVIVNGKLSNRSFTNQMGDTQYVTEVVALAVSNVDTMIIAKKPSVGSNAVSGQVGESGGAGGIGNDVSPDDILF